MFLTTSISAQCMILFVKHAISGVASMKPDAQNISHSLIFTANVGLAFIMIIAIMSRHLALTEEDTATHRALSIRALNASTSNALLNSTISIIRILRLLYLFTFVG